MSFSGTILDFFLVFGAGVAVSFTPCLYPVMPLTAAFIAGANPAKSRWFGLVLSLIYVLGLAITYAGLGLAASLTGKVFGQHQNSPYVHLVIAFGLLFFGLMMLDVIRIGAWNVGAQGPQRPKNLFSVLVFGMLSGLVVGPCTAPALGSILLFVASKQSPAYAAFLLFTFAYGVGFSLILVGTFSGLLARLPRSGAWLLRVKQACGAVLLIASAYFVIKAFGMLKSVWG